MALQKKFVLPPPPNPDADVNDYSWRDWFRQLRDYLVSRGEILWSQIDFTGSNIKDIVTRKHNDLQTIQGGSSLLSEYYHLTGVEYTGTGTGVFVRQNSPSISGPTIDGTNPYIQFNNGVAVTNAAGRMWYNGTTGSLNFGMGGGNITQQVGEEFFRYGKASSDISDTNLQLVYKTGVVGASGVITFAPTIAGITDPDQILGIATEPIAANSFGRVTTMGVVRGINTTGSVYGETWANNDDIWYNPVTGGLTKTKPSAPNIKLQVGTVINAGSGGSGSFNVKLGSTSALGGTDSNVQLGTLSNNDLLVYDSSLQYWKNLPSTSVPTGTATNADNIKTVSTATNANYYLTFVDSNNGVAAYEAVYTDAGITYNPSTNVLTVNVTGDVTGNVSGNAGTVTNGVYTTGSYSNPAWITSLDGSKITSTPVTKTADFTVGSTDKWIINNKSGSTCTVTLPSASTNTGRELHFQNYQNYTVVSASSNVVPIDGSAASTAILADVAGDTCTLVSNGTNWVMTQYTPNNVLLI